MNRILPDTSPAATADAIGWGKAATSATVTCATCKHGCDCRMDNPTAGCGHYCCWGPAATSTCPGVALMRARSSKLFGGAA